MKVRMNEVRKGNLVRVSTEGWARVECVVEIERNGTLIKFSESGLMVTPKHPIRLFGDEWQHPVDFIASGEARVTKCTNGHVYNFVLDGGRSLLVNGVECLTFGHGVTKEKAWDEFYATERVLDVLSNLKGFSEGLVSVKGSLKAYEREL
eukprot:TRINITY_DN9384_c0_g1_i5.p1 TRINITY_DN9384_c0_g1~~TRINITY_DN9384_c0_g1_i5.p1  ORF type:complete len:150 (-),score=39.52 TRINITY_DN9384_c0_g1_i5:106-555(-)